jgi:NACHT domain
MDYLQELPITQT